MEDSRRYDCPWNSFSGSTSQLLLRQNEVIRHEPTDVLIAHKFIDRIAEHIAYSIRRDIDRKIMLINIIPRSLKFGLGST